MKRSKDFMLRLMAAATVGAMLSPLEAFAQNNFNNIVGNIGTASSRMPSLVTTVAYIGGLGLGVSGIMAIKQHVDNPAQAPLKNGLIRLAAGGALLAFPGLTDAMSSITGAGTMKTYTAAGAIAYP